MYKLCTCKFNLIKMFKNNYLANCDLVNKYLLTDIYSIPKIKTIKLNFSLRDFASNVDFHGSYEKKDLILKYKTFTICFLLNANIPFLKNVNFNTFSKNNDVSNFEDFFLSLIFSEKKSLNNFLFSIFIENNENLKKFNTIDNMQFISCKKNIYTISTKIPMTYFYDIAYLFNSNIISTNLKEIYMNVDFIFKNKFIKNKKNIIKSIPFFWYHI